jgi:prevent-host-death family protein
MTLFFPQASDAQASEQPAASLANFHGWKLEEAKARFSEVVRLARDSEPQRITVRGEDAVVILSAKAFAKVLPLLAQPSLHALLSQSPLSRLDFEQPSVQSPVRDVEL